MTRRINWDALVSQIMEFATAHPSGFTVDELKASVGESHAIVNRGIRRLRDILAEDDINLTCEPAGSHERWTYRLIGNLQDARPWTSNRIGDTERRLRTMRSMLKSVVNATDRRTQEGKRAMVMHRAISRLVEDLDDLSEVERAGEFEEV